MQIYYFLSVDEARYTPGRRAMTDRVGAGRYAPSPTGELHLGNLRTAVLAWLFARSTDRRFLLRIEDLDATRVRPGQAGQQMADLAALGLDFDGEPVATRLVRPVSCTLATCGRLYWPGCSRARRDGSSCCASRTSMPSGYAPDWPSSSSRT